MAIQANTPQIISVSLRKFVQEAGITTISQLRSNASGYPYVTLVTKESASFNLYFGQKSAEVLPVVGSKIVHLLKDATIVQTVNAAGEIRFKMSIPKAGQAATGYAQASEMNELFGAVEESAFDMQALKAQFNQRVLENPLVTA